MCLRDDKVATRRVPAANFSGGTTVSSKARRFRPPRLVHGWRAGWALAPRERTHAQILPTVSTKRFCTPRPWPTRLRLRGTRSGTKLRVGPMHSAWSTTIWCGSTNRSGIICSINSHSSRSIHNRICNSSRCSTLRTTRSLRMCSRRRRSSSMCSTLGTNRMRITSSTLRVRVKGTTTGSTSKCKLGRARTPRS